MKKIFARPRLMTISVVCAFLFCSAFTCSVKAPTLLQEIANAAAIVTAAVDPAISPYVIDAQQQINCALAPGTTVEKVDSCLALALQQYEAALPNASAKDKGIVQAVITAIEGFVNDNAPGGTVTASTGVVQPSLAKQQVKNTAAKAPSVKQFKANFNAALKSATVTKKL